MSRDNSRFLRSSFEGLSFSEKRKRQQGKVSPGVIRRGYAGAKAVPSPATTTRDIANRDFQFYKEQNERRKRSTSFTQSQQVREIIQKRVDDLSGETDGDSVPRKLKSAEESLKDVLTKAKESGHSAEKIFSILSNSYESSKTKTTKKVGSSSSGDNEEELVPKETFVAGLKKLGCYSWKADQLEYIAGKFDINGDGFISLTEFRHYCYHEILSVAWRAERQRKERTSGLAKVVDESEERHKEEKIFYCGPEVFKTSKLMWKIDITVGIALRYCEELDVITIQINNIMSKEDFNTLYVRKKDCAIDQKALEDATKTAIQTSGERNELGKESIRNYVHWEFYSDYLVRRLLVTRNDGNRKGTYCASLMKLHGDKFTSLEIERPANISDPPFRNHRVSWVGTAIKDEFRKGLKELQPDAKALRTSRQTAQGISNVISNSLDDIEAHSAFNKRLP